ncbi:MAG: glycosyltransferase [Bifidobacteriaceae bacterium]|nr:glycosyltransferase [Bifidobacteriaceae bacterium]
MNTQQRQSGAAKTISVLMPVYRNDKPDQVKEAFRSVTSGQLEPPDEVVIVRDGPVPVQLNWLLADWAKRGDVTLVELRRNQGLAAALNAGLSRCRNDIVARQDADDISRPDRFKLTWPRLAVEGFDLVGGAMREFGLGDGGAAAVREFGLGGDSQDQTVRSYPLISPEIEHQARLMNPLAHPTVMFRRAVVLEAGGYRPFFHLEDYDLWVRLMMAGARIANLPDVLVDYRVSEAAYRRRGGLRTLRAELALQREFVRTGFIGPATMARNLVVRGGFEVAPVWLRRIALTRLHDS